MTDEKDYKDIKKEEIKWSRRDYSTDKRKQSRLKYIYLNLGIK